MQTRDFLQVGTTGTGQSLYRQHYLVTANIVFVLQNACDSTANIVLPQGSKTFPQLPSTTKSYQALSRATKHYQILAIQQTEQVRKDV